MTKSNKYSTFNNGDSIPQNRKCECTNEAQTLVVWAFSNFDRNLRKSQLSIRNVYWRKKFRRNSLLSHSRNSITSITEYLRLDIAYNANPKQNISGNLLCKENSSFLIWEASLASNIRQMTREELEEEIDGDTYAQKMMELTTSVQNDD